jgi:hypothetical protein
VLAGDVAAVDLGLSGREAADLQERMSVLYHLEEPSDRGSRALRAAREVAEFASGADCPSVVVIAPPGRGRRTPVSEPLRRVLSGRGSDLRAVVLATGVCTGSEGPWPSAGRGRLLHLIVLLHLSVDIRRLRSVAARRLVLTWAPFAAEAALRAARGARERVRHRELDLRDPRPPTLAEVDRSLSGMLEGVGDVDGEFLSTCRRHRDSVIERWIGGEDPVELLAAWTLPESLGGGGERTARDLGLEWHPTGEVLRAGLGAVVRDMRADLLDEAGERDALLG